MQRIQAADFIGAVFNQPDTADMYRIIGYLGKGATSWVFKAQTQDGTIVAIKIIRKSVLYRRQGSAARKKMATEVDILWYNAKWNIPNLAQCLASWSDLCFAYIVMVRHRESPLIRVS